MADGPTVLDPQQQGARKSEAHQKTPNGNFTVSRSSLLRLGQPKSTTARRDRRKMKP